MKDRIVVVSTCRDAGPNARKCILSVAKQEEKNHHIFIDDGTKDQSDIALALVESTRFRRMKGSTIAFQRYERDEGRCALQNVYDAVSRLEPSAIVCWVDGDDWLAHSEALGVIRNTYHDPNVWMTWGQFVWNSDGSMGFASEFPPQIRMLNNYRNDIWRATHLKTFRAGLFQKIKQKDLLREIAIDGRCYDSWLTHAIDLAVMFPMLEMARYNSKFVELPLYVYSGVHVPVNPGTEAWDEAQRIRAMPKYGLLSERPW